MFHCLMFGSDIVTVFPSKYKNTPRGPSFRAGAKPAVLEALWTLGSRNDVPRAFVENWKMR